MPVLRLNACATFADTIVGESMMLRSWLWFAVALAAPAQSTHGRDLGVGKLLVASKELKDPNFAQTVVLLVRYDEEGVVGLIINRQSSVPLSRVFGDLKEAKGHADPVYAGGPVERKSALALLRSREKPEEADRVFADVNLVSSEALLEQTMGSGAEASRFRVYLGYAGWSVDQLENEIELGAWHIFPADAGAVFDANPDALWSKLIRKTEERIARKSEGFGGLVDSLPHGAQYAGQGGRFAIRLVPSACFGRLPDAGQRLRAVAGVEARRIDLMFEPLASRQAGGQQHGPLRAI